VDGGAVDDQLRGQEGRKKVRGFLGEVPLVAGVDAEPTSTPARGPRADSVQDLPEALPGDLRLPLFPEGGWPAR
jgi:hypothetical protein